MENALKELTSGELVVIVLSLGWLLNKALDSFLEQRKLKSTETSIILKEQTTALNQNTLAIQKLEIQLESLNEAIRVVPKLKEDVRVAFTKIKELENGRRSR